MSRRSPIIKNWPKYLLQWGVLAAIVISYFYPFFPADGYRSLASYLSQESMPGGMTIPQVLTGIALVAGVVLFSRLFCAFICPVGTVQDLMRKARVLMHIKDIKIRNGSFPDKLFRIVKYALVFCIFYIAPYFSTGVMNETVIWVSVSAAALVVFGSFVIDMFWCRYICPVGAISNTLKFWVWIGVVFGLYYLGDILGADIPWAVLLGAFCIIGYLLEVLHSKPKMQVLYMMKDNFACTKCGVCRKTCPFHIDIMSHRNARIESVDCNLCGECAASCTANALKVGVRRNGQAAFWKYVPALIAAGLIALFTCTSAKADEGMWMINAIDAALEKKMQERGLELSAREIYNADAPGASVADAVVSMEFGCTGCIVSDRGLLITNHHCAYSDIHRLSTPEHNYLEDGFWAMRADEEVNIPGKSVYFLKKVLDVTDEVMKLQADLIAEGKPSGSRRLSHLMEQKYSKATGLEAFLSSMWRGSKYYLALYEVYRDVRLVAAPPVSSAAFGGDIDNWEWPQHKCDFAMYRVYTAPDGSPVEFSEDNVPMKPVRKLSISLDGYQAGDYTMVIGYPGSTNRYSSSFETDFTETLKHPVNNAIRGRQMDIIKGWMDRDPETRLKYSDYFFSLSNMQECFSGEQECFGRFDVVEQKEEIEKELQEWILSSPERVAKWGGLLEALKKGYDAIRDIERNQSYYRETMIRGSQLAVIMRRAHNPRNQTGIGEKMLEKYAEIDLRVEKDLIAYAVEVFVNNLDLSYMSPWHLELIESYSSHGVCDTKSLAEALWNSSIFTSEEGIARLGLREVSPEEIASDSLCRFVMDVKVTDFTEAKADAEGTPGLAALHREYTHALYQMRTEKGVVQYPDANSTMRITYGKVSGLEPRDGVVCDWKTTPAGILEKYDPADYDFSLNDRQYLLYKSGQWGSWGFGPEGKSMYVNFLTDNDITGGNSGSPVLNSRGELIGLAFDGNKESLASDAMWTEGYNKCVCVDIRFILWTLDRYAGMTRIIDELGL